MKSKKTRFSEVASLVLPYLPPPSLAALSATSSALRHLSLSITSLRSSDASRTIETHPIPFVNAVDSTPYSYFLYTPTSIPSPGPTTPPPQSWPLILSPAEPATLPTIGSGCRCDRQCNYLSICPCPGECGPLCLCGPHCPNRETQIGISVKLKIIRHPKKGWGLHSGERIKKSQFVCEYAGEYVTTEEARKRQRIYDEDRSVPMAMMVVREHLPSGKACLRVNIDATRIGNVGRFVNHACDEGNLEGVVVRRSGEVMPRLCFFARREVEEGEELCFSYGDGVGERDCCCGTTGCRGKLPCEDT